MAIKDFFPHNFKAVLKMNKHLTIFQTLFLFCKLIKYLWLRMVGCSLVAESEGFSLVAVCRLLTAAASLAVAHRLWAPGLSSAAPGPQDTGSAAVVRGLICSAACGIFMDQGLNLYPLHWQADSYPLSHQGNPKLFSLKA